MTDHVDPLDDGYMAPIERNQRDRDDRVKQIIEDIRAKLRGDAA